MMQKVRWVMDGEFWEVDVSTPITLEGVARVPPATATTVPLGGVSRGTRLSRPKQLQFFHRFMSAPFIPCYSYSDGGLSLQRVLSLPFAFGFTTLLAQFNLHKFISSSSSSSWVQSLSDKSLYALNLCSELLLTPDTSLLLSLEQDGTNNHTSSPSPRRRKKAVLHHKFVNHNLTVVASSPQLFIDNLGNYWDVPFSMAIDLASVPSDSTSSFHFSINHNHGTPILQQHHPHPHQDQEEAPPPASLLPGLCLKTAFSVKKSIGFWRSKAPKLKLVQPYDLFLSSPHISASGILGAVLTACQGKITTTSSPIVQDSKLFKGFILQAPRLDSTISADICASLLLSAQHGNFQRLFLDLTRVHARLDFPSASKFFSGAALVAQDFFNSDQPSPEALQAIRPKATVSLQQQIAGPFSFRVDSGVSFNLKKNSSSVISMDDPVFAIEYALQVLGSAKAVAWYSPTQQECMIELRFFET